MKGYTTACYSGELKRNTDVSVSTILKISSKEPSRPREFHARPTVRRPLPTGDLFSVKIDERDACGESHSIATDLDEVIEAYLT